MYIQFSGKTIIGGSIDFSSDQDNQEELKKSFLDSVAGGKDFSFVFPRGETFILNVFSIKKMGDSNGYMAFEATASYPKSFFNTEKDIDGLVEGIISFNV